MKHVSFITVLAGILMLLTVDGMRADSPLTRLEPSVELARTWWDEETNVWTPVGWKDNYFRYVVLYNGALIIDPAHGLMGPRPHSKDFVGKDFMIQLHAPANGKLPALPAGRINVREIDYGHGIQGWNTEHETPLLWTEHRIQSGVVIRQEVFAHQVGSSDVQSGLEPLYAWVRVKVVWVDPMRSPENQTVSLRLSRVFYEHDAECYDPRSSEPSFKIMLNPEMAPYGQSLTARSYFSNGLEGMYVTEPDGNVRLGVLPAESGRVSFYKDQEGVYGISLVLKAEEGDHLDLLVPMFPQPMSDFTAEADLTYDGALTLSDWYWGNRPTTAARISIPEKYIEEAIGQNLKFASVVAERDHKTGQYSYLTGAWGYDCMWPTPTSTVSHMMADQLGYHDMTMRHSEIFRLNQGTIKAPGDVYPIHPGYYGAPRTLTSIDWLSDHGAILHQIATSCLLSGDSKYVDEWIGSILSACDFIKEMSAVDTHDGIKGLLPPAVSSDDGICTQAVWNIAWNYKGLTSAVRLLKSISHPRYEEFASLARETKRIFVEEYRKIAEDGPRWTDESGRKRYLPPTTMSSKPMPFHVFSEAFYLDTGPMVLVWAGLMDADDPIMEDLVEFFREGPNRRYYTPVYNCIWRPSLHHEMSTCEPCYSFNIFHSWQKGDRYRYLEGMYSLFTGGMSQNTYISCEHRHGIQGNLFVAPLAIYLAKLAVIDDSVEPDILHLMRFCPLAWISDKEATVFENVPTGFGTVDLKFSLSSDKKTLNVDFSSRWRNAPSSVRLHIPPVEGLETVVVNGVSSRVKDQNGPIEVR